MTFNLAWLISVKIIYVKHTMCVCVFDESYSCNINDMILRSYAQSFRSNNESTSDRGQKWRIRMDFCGADDVVWFILI